VVFACRLGIELYGSRTPVSRALTLMAPHCTARPPRKRCLYVLAVLAAWSIAGAHAETPGAYCARTVNDNALRPIPEGLVAAAGAALGTTMPPDVAVKSTVFRCANGRVLVCTVGANLVCGRANISRAPGRGQLEWCREHPNDTFIPLAAAGHDTIYAWRCQDGVPRIDRQILDVDARGFVRQNWRQLP
jgi:hypothetical protein